ncbi:MAG: class I tRNA ligase family protein [Candidatus Moranbacteria bacterium]|nr:class I tRNA ligase family protein [Candidatus Moranbacteria bacterium]
MQKMSVLIQETREDIENFRFSQAGEKLREFTWNDFADWYIEASKFEKTPEKNKILILVLKDLLKLWHPFMPFVTEHVWKQFGEKNLLMVTKWPTEENYWNIASASQTDFLNFELVKEIIKAIRRARLESKIEPHRKISVIIDTRSHQQYLGINTYALIHSQENLIRSLRTGIKELKITSEGKRIKSAIHRTVAGINIYIPTKGLVDIKKERDKAKKELENLKKFISGIESRMKNKQFLEKAPQKVIEGQKESLRKAKTKFSEIKKHIEDLG